MNRKEAEDYIYKSYMKAKKYQDYHARDDQKRHPELTKELIRKNSNTPCVVVTGSKGKGSVSNMISQIMQSDRKVGLMTSPHLVNFCERFKINGKNISDDEFTEQMSLIKTKIDEIDEKIPENMCISPMGIQTMLAIRYFHVNKTSFNVFECGKGARFDDVNNVIHKYAVINPIFLEHTRELGESLEEIAEDKVHIVTGEQRCVYSAKQNPEVMEIIQNTAKKYKVPLKVYGEDFYAENICYTRKGMIFDIVIGEKIYPEIQIPLLGEHQAENCALAMALCEDELGEIDFEIVKQKLNELDWPGRMEIISSEPFILLDACINTASCKNVKQVLNYLGLESVTLIVGIPDDKDFAGVVKIMNESAQSIILTKSHNPHYIFSRVQKEVLERQGIVTEWTESVEDALCAAEQKGRPIVILGTTSVVAEIKRMKNKIINECINFFQRPKS
ncbi:MAG: Mur ligase family protein [Schaedlerella sp.]|nr:Mur ligase family protein [Schaedlerella sp.]